MGINDSDTPLAILKKRLLEFRDNRDWKQFHDAKNLAEAISIESGELLEHFLWKDTNAVSKEWTTDDDFQKSVQSELADVFIFSLNLANALDLDVSSLVIDKINENDRKYPAQKARGSAKKYTHYK